MSGKSYRIFVDPVLWLHKLTKILEGIAARSGASFLPAVNLPAADPVRSIAWLPNAFWLQVC